MSLGLHRAILGTKLTQMVLSLISYRLQVSGLSLEIIRAIFLQPWVEALGATWPAGSGSQSWRKALYLQVTWGSRRSFFNVIQNWFFELLMVHLLLCLLSQTSSQHVSHGNKTPEQYSFHLLDTKGIGQHTFWLNMPKI